MKQIIYCNIMARQMFMLYTVNEISNMRKRISPLQYLAGESGDPS